MEEGREGRKGRWHRRRHSLACPLGDDLAAQIGLANYLPRLCGRGGGRRAAAGGGGSIGMLHSAATPSVASLPSLSYPSRNIASTSSWLAPIVVGVSAYSSLAW